MPEKNYNLIVSGQPGSGGTTTALILANILKLKYIYAGGVLKEWAKRMGYDPKSERLHDWEKKYGKAFDDVWETYIKIKMQGQKGFLCEGKTAGFLFPEGIAVETMIMASAEARAQRGAGDGRSENVIERDELLRKRWLEAFGIDMFDLETIKQNYQIVVDNSNLSIADTVLQILDQLPRFLSSDIKINYDPKDIKDIDRKFWLHNKEKSGTGKEELKKQLENSGLHLSPAEIFKDMPILTATEFARLPEEMKKAALI